MVSSVGKRWKRMTVGVCATPETQTWRKVAGQLGCW